MKEGSLQSQSQEEEHSWESAELIKGSQLETSFAAQETREWPVLLDLWVGESGREAGSANMKLVGQGI